MDLIQAFKKKLQEMADEDVRRAERVTSTAPVAGALSVQDSKGIALLMVIAAVSTLSFLVTEFTYVAQLNQKLAYDDLDQVKAHYLAKSGFKLSLLRLKAYRTVKGLLSAKENATAAAGVPQSVLNQIWAFPFMYPIPPIPGMSAGDKEALKKFQSESGFEGSYTAVIDSESSKLNLNMILAGFQGANPSPSPSASPSPGAAPNQPNTSPNPKPSPSFDPASARKGLQDYFSNILSQQELKDPDFQSEYRDFRIEDFMDNLIAWADPTYERKQSGLGDNTPFKHAPFYSVTEMHMLPGMDDQLYNLLTPNLTVSRTPGINLNTMREPVLRAIVPQMTDDEVSEFFKFRDSQEEDNSFKDADAFYKYLSNSVAALKGDTAMNQFKQDLQSRNIRLVTDESEFKITVKATVNQSVRVLEAWVTLNPDTKGSTSSAAPSPTPTTSGSTGNKTTPQATSDVPDPGLKINFMRFL